MGLARLAYVILDGYDLGVGMWLPFATDSEKDVMVSSIGHVWDANETWLVLGVGWHIMKTDGQLQRKATRWCQGTLWPMGFALAGISLVTPLVTPHGVQQMAGAARVVCSAADSTEVRGGVLCR